MWSVCIRMCVRWQLTLLTPTPQNITGASTNADCVVCTPGMYCAATASAGPTGACDAGYYCDGGATGAGARAVDARQREACVCVLVH